MQGRRVGPAPAGGISQSRGARCQEQQPEQDQRCEAPHEVGRQDDRLELERDGPHAQDGLEDDQAEQRERQHHRLPRVAAGAPGKHHQDQCHDPEGARGVAVTHLLPCLAHLHGPLREGVAGRLDLHRLDCRRESPAATGPARAAGAPTGQAHEGAQHDHRQAEHHTQADSEAKQRRRVHDQPMREFLSNLFRSLSMPRDEASVS
jgi:hypothetical protein